MPIELDEIVPWGRLYDEYRRMFGLTEEDAERKILDCGGGPSSFNYELTLRGGRVVSVDPIYGFDRTDIEIRIKQTCDKIISGVRENKALYVWDDYRDPDGLGQARMTAMRLFLHDFERGKAEGRYRPHELPGLPFRNKEFGLCLCSHLLFMFSKLLTLDAHIAYVREMCRVADEVRIFPLLDVGCAPSPHIAPVMEAVIGDGHFAEIRQVEYEFQKGGNEALFINCKQ